MKVLTKKLTKVALSAAVLGLLTVGGQGVSAQETAKKVGQVVDIDGTKLTTNRLKEDKWYQAYQSMPTFFKERLTTDANTTATIAFDVGGRAVISKGSKVEILNEDVVRLKSGTMWAKFDKEKLAGGGKKFEIETSGGVMGIEGTEFIVQTNPDGTTELIVVEGTVDVSGNKVTKGKAASFGDQAYDVAEYAAYNTPESALRDAAFGRLDPDTRGVLRPVVNRALWYVPGRYRWGRFFYGRNYGTFRNVVRAFRDPGGAAVSEIQNQTGVRAPFGLGRAVSKATEPARKPRGIKAEGATPTFQWEKSRRTDHYGVIVATDSDMEDVVWYGRTKGNETKLSYPSYGPELEANKSYYVMVSSLDSDGKPRANKKNGVLVDKTYFRGQGHTPVYRALGGVTVEAESGAPKVKWKKLKDAQGYRISFKDSSGSLVWSGESDKDANYQYPETGRGLAAGDYQVEVEAYDAAGLKMAESSPTTFASQGWQAIGLEVEGWEARSAETQGALPQLNLDVASIIRQAQEAGR